MIPEQNGHVELDRGCGADATATLTQSNGAVTRKRRRPRWHPSPKTRLRTLEHDLDGRTHAAQKAKLTVSGLTSDLGGSEQVTVSQHQLIMRAAILSAFIEDIEVKWLRKEPVAVGEWFAAINALRRCLVSLGLERRARNVGTSLGEVLRNGNRSEATP
jgi:hypothetical protein